MAKLKFHDLTISAVRSDTASSVELSFDIPAALADDFVFEPGQYLTLRAMVDGQDLRRSYSICSPLGAPRLSVGIKRIEGGAFSSFALGLKPGDVVQVMPPQGQVHGANWRAAQLFAFGRRLRCHANQIHCTIRVGGRSR
jgi:ring-1,2-phenylacetyl-CoA epoxidase subunit PaaE